MALGELETSLDERGISHQRHPAGRESPSAGIRSISRCFESELEDKPWFYDLDCWSEYLSMLATHRFNRLAMTLGMQYNYPYGNECITDTYLYFAYPFLVSSHAVSVQGLDDAERDRNLDVLRFVSREATRRGPQFQLALWTHGYDFDDVPNASHYIAGITKSNHARYCRDALAAILEVCPDIAGVTFRAHVESGIQEGSYDFWATVFEAIAGAGRPMEIDVHAKGVDQRLIELALAAASSVNVSPKYISEQMGLPYHQAAIRPQESPPRESVDAKWKCSEGSRKFLRYSYGDLPCEDRRYGILYRIWPGTQRVLLWRDPVMAGGYGRSSMFCGSAGVELCEPLSFKGRMGTGIENGRYNYTDQSLVARYDWEKYRYTYRVWGRLNYCPSTDPDSWLRQLRKQLGPVGDTCAEALANASRIFPLITLAHGVSASNNSYWPEMYENMSIVHKAPHLPYSYDMHRPSRFGEVGACDPQLFYSPEVFARRLLAAEPIRRYAPLTVAAWFRRFGSRAQQLIEEARPGMTWNAGRLVGEIPSAYTDSPFPLQ